MAWATKVLRSILICVLVAVPLWAEDLFVGTWVLNVTKSRLDGPYATLKSENLVIQEKGKRLFIVASVTRQDGSAANSREEVSKNGGDLKYVEGTLPPGVSRRVKRMDADALEITTRRNGVQIQIDSIIVNNDRNEMRITRRGALPNGEHFESTEVLDRKS